MEKTRSDSRNNPIGSTPSAESSPDLERNYCKHTTRSSSPLQAYASGGQFTESSAAYFSWPTTSRLNDAAEDRLNYFRNLQKGVLPETYGRLPEGQQATTLLDVMTVRAYHSKILRRCSLGTAVGFRIRGGCLTNIPAILVFVSRKVNRQWLNHNQCLPAALEGPGGVWCDVDVVEFSYFGAPAVAPKEEFYTELADGLRGSDPFLGSGSQVASQVTYGTLGAIVKSRSGKRQIGFITNRHVAVDLDYPNQKMFHPLPPSLGPGVYLGVVERATSFITDDLWYGIFAGTNPETFVRADGAFIAFAESFNISNVSTSVKGIGDIGEVNTIDLQSSINSLIGRQVMKVGRSSGLTTGTIMAYALEYNDEKGICFLTDFLVVGQNQQTFDLEGDSGSLILLAGQNGDKPRPVGIIWGGTANRGRLKLKVGQPPENWTSGVDLGRLLDLLELDLITTGEALQASVRDQRNPLTAGMDSSYGESSPNERQQLRECTENLYKPLEIISMEGASHYQISRQFMHKEFHIEGDGKLAPNDEHQFIPSVAGISMMHQNDKQGNADSENLPALRSCEDISISLQLGDPGQKRRKQSDYLLVTEDLNINEWK